MSNSQRSPVWVMVVGATMVPMLGACSNQQLYEFVRNWRLQECMCMVDDMEYRQCMDEVMMSYADYQRLRNELPPLVQNEFTPISPLDP